MKIVVLDGVTLNPGDNPWTPIEQFGELTVYDSTEPDQVLSRCDEADIVLTNKVVLDDEILNQLPNLKFISVTATGYNVVDLKAAKARRIPVSNVPVYSTEAVAQHVFAMLLAFIHQPEAHSQAVADGKWMESGQFSFWLKPITELKGKTFGVVGWGRIGKATAAIAKAFDMRVVASSRRQADAPDWDGFEWLSIEQLTEHSDVVSLHCPLNEDSEGMVDANFLASMKPEAILINTARGGLVNESDLAVALKSNQIGGALLDVVSSEPMPDNHPLRSIKNCLVTPHVAWTTVEARQRLMNSTAGNIQAFLDGWPRNVVNS
jgi:glycerate dehydrogenase